MRPGSKDFTHFKDKDGNNEEWAKEVRARVADLNELLDQAASRDVIVTGQIAMPCGFMVGGADHLKPFPTLSLTLSQRI